MAFELYSQTLPMYSLLLNHIAKHISLTEEETLHFTSFIKVRQFRKRQFLLQEGDVSRYENFVNKGCLRTFYTNEKGQEHVIQFSIEEWWTGDLYSFLTATPSRYNIEALENSEVFSIDKPALEKLYIDIPKFERLFRILFQNAFIAQEKRIIDNMSRTAEERYLDFLQKYPQLEQRLPQHQVAAWLGITPESLSRIRRQLTGK